ncbi:hypothetical protein C8Q69DRAFT_482915 [Paecilomyces variotii]|uniref:Rhodopsin domain-containing protein n=1 Tax=Byssochlamys spectabilis TaxID=264951 RepID=A0A443HHT4_BYSSP|nr:hypothetical protein C8Q69DRAFT_482915 [Paecilomyces variotii]KAJ9219937.1 hypothetical protein DTO169C6_7705 [Paecilomyces variotii]KAJ9305213.1 hypothetical protein DTO217A2_5264 [Paecilomyces variotii]KAJ9315339.1 hypothetical protein DTO271D3_4506 [Paecilomyces variotii]KAJ9321661.1 hypothetical protein DTO027B3_7309 [Paecilomyces variotii]KAJ9331328.1 hypothetical protein DTO027B5_6888 [Paecilomyces variotii]
MTRVFENASNLQPWSIATCVSVTGLAFVTVCLRLLSRYERKQKLWWDDYMVIFSMVWNIMVLGFILGMIKYGMGLHADTIPPEHVVMIAKLLVVAEVLYVYNLVWTKISFLLMYYRIFHVPYFKKWAYIIGTFVVLWVITIMFAFIFICVPVEKLWTPSLPGHCINQVGTWIANACSTIATDLAILVLPIPQVWKLQLARSQKIALTIAFCLGFFVVFASAYRFTVLFSYSALDSSYTLAPTVGWTAIEISAGIISACLPTLRPALQLFARKCGIKGFMSDLRTTPATGYSGTGRSKGGSHGPGTTIDSTTSHARSESQRRFYRLDDESGTGQMESDRFPIDSSLRPKHGYIYTTSVLGTTKNNDADSLSGDEVPLHSIRVQKDFKQVEG